MRKKDGARAVVLDLDGTLIDSYTSGVRLMQRVYADLGHAPPDWNLVRRLWGTYWPTLLEMVSPQVDRERFHRRWRELEATERLECPPIPGAREAVMRLREKGLHVVLHTNRGKRERLDARLEEAGLHYPNLFLFTHTPDHGTPPKPNPDSLRGVLRRLVPHGVASSKYVITVSDQAQDAEMACACEVGFIGVLTGAATSEDFEPFGKKVAVVSSIADVPNVI